MTPLGAPCSLFAAVHFSQFHFQAADPSRESERGWDKFLSPLWANVHADTDGTRLGRRGQGRGRCQAGPFLDPHQGFSREGGRVNAGQLTTLQHFFPSKHGRGQKMSSRKGCLFPPSVTHIPDSINFSLPLFRDTSVYNVFEGEGLLHYNNS